jgi:hypothetical protein
MSSPYQKFLTSIIAATCASYIGSDALAQSNSKQSDPNLKMFYMARQQVQIIDDSPVVTNQKNIGNTGGNGALPAGPMPLPHAGWQPYSSSVTAPTTSLPKVNNGVPPKTPPPNTHSPNGLKGKTGALHLKPAPNNNVVQTYTPYKGYGSNTPAPASGSGANTTQSTSNVKGSVLHWARARHQSY